MDKAMKTMVYGVGVLGILYGSMHLGSIGAKPIDIYSEDFNKDGTPDIVVEKKTFPYSRDRFLFIGQKDERGNVSYIRSDFIKRNQKDSLLSKQDSLEKALEQIEQEAENFGR